MNRGAANSQNQVGASGRGARWGPWVILGTVCALVIGFFAWSARPGWREEINTPRAEDAYYNLLVQGFRAGQLNLKMEVPPGFAQLADPYDPIANAQYREAEGHPLWDLSYYHGKLYLYFGVTPALVLFWPYAALTGHYLSHKDAVVVFCAIGFLASVVLLCLMWRRYFAEIGLAVVAAGALALGLAPFTPVILSRANVYEVPISCGYALTMLALLALWEACHRPERRGRWLAAASLAYGLALGARPNFLFGAVILLVPVAQALRERRQVWAPLLAATVPITCVGLGLMLYNTLRFDNPLEFGNSYMLTGVGMPTFAFLHNFLRFDCLGFNSWVYFLGPARWGTRFPFVHNIQLPPLPARFMLDPEHPFGVLTNIPLVWLVVAAPLAWPGRAADVRCLLRGFLAAVAWIFVTRALLLVCFLGTCVRYEMDFCPALVLLAVVGILGLERALADRPAWRRAARWTWGLLLAFSLAFNLLASVIRQAEYHWKLGTFLLDRRQVNEAIAHLRKALRLEPDNAAVHNNLGVAFAKKGQFDEAIGQYREALRFGPGNAETHNNLATALFSKGRIDEAIGQYREALRFRSGNAETHNDLGVALDEKGQTDEAIREYREALRLKPDYTEAYNNLGVALDEKGQTDEAIGQYQQALRLKPDHAQARNNLGLALSRKGQTDEAIRQFQEVIRRKPDYADARYNLGVALLQRGRVNEAIRQLQEAVRLQPNHAEAHNNLGTALGMQGQTDEAIRQFQEAVKLKPDYADARRNLNMALARRADASHPPEAPTNR